MEITEFTGEDFKVVKKTESWKIGFLRYSDRFADFGVLERHMETEESFILMEGSAVLYEDFQSYDMEKGKVYSISKGVWHHIVVSKDATVIVVENADTSLENTERKPVVS